MNQFSFIDADLVEEFTESIGMGTKDFKEYEKLKATARTITEMDIEKILNKLIDELPLGLDLTRGDHDEEAGEARDKGVSKILSLLKGEK